MLRGNLAVKNPNYVQKLQLHSTLEVELTSSCIDLKMLGDGALLT